MLLVVSFAVVLAIVAVYWCFAAADYNARMQNAQEKRFLEMDHALAGK